MLIALKKHEDDSAKFIDLASRLVSGVACVAAVDRLYVVKIDRWFSAKWCRFSGKTLGALGIWKGRLTIPPFVPSRVVGEVCYEGKPDGSYLQVPPEKPIHLQQPSAENLKRFVERFDPSAAFVWYSGATAELRRGCLMAYIPVSDGYAHWYAEIQLHNEARFGLVRGISRQELDAWCAAACPSGCSTPEISSSL